MAVYYELEDRLDSAANLLDRAAALKQDKMILDYQKDMHRRLEKKQSVQELVDGARLRFP